MTDRLTELSNSAHRRAQVVGSQLQSVEASLLGALLSVIMSVLISTALSLLAYWIPVSFLLIWSILMLSLVKSLISLKRRMRGHGRTEPDRKLQISSSLSATDRFLLTTGFKNSKPVMRLIGVVFLISFLLLLVYRAGLIAQHVSFSTTIPLVSSLLFIPLPVLVNVVVGKLEKSEPELDFARIHCLGWVIILVTALAYIAAMLVLSMWSLVVLRPIYSGELASVLSLIAVVFFLMMIAVGFMNYFSASLLRKELGTALFHLSSVLDRIESLEPSQSVPDEVYEALRAEYGKATRYNMAVDDTLLVNYYSIRANPSYLSELDAK